MVSKDIMYCETTTRTGRRKILLVLLKRRKETYDDEPETTGSYQRKSKVSPFGTVDFVDGSCRSRILLVILFERSFEGSGYVRSSITTSLIEDL